MKGPTVSGAGTLAIVILARAVDWRKKPKKPLPQHTNKKRTLLPCLGTVMRGRDGSAAASCFQMLMKSKGVKISRDTALERLDIEGAEEEAMPRQVQLAVATYYKRWRLNRIKSPEREIDKGNLVMAVATKEKPQDHVVILKGYNKDYFWVVNPLYRGSYKKKKTQVHFEALGEYYALRVN